MKALHRLALVVVGTALLGGCEGPCQKIDLGAPSVGRAQVDFSRYVAVGTSISSGYQSGGLVNRHQITGFPAIFARQIGKTVLLEGTGSFSEPTVDGNGIPPLYFLQGLYPAPDIARLPGGPGSPTNTTYAAPYSNLAVPGAILFDLGNPARYASGYFPLVLRGQGTIGQQLLLQQPTFISFEFGANEVLGAASSGSAKVYAPPTDPGTFAALLQGAVQAIHSAVPDARMAIANVPNVTTIPYFTTIPPTGLWGRVHRVVQVPSPNVGRDTIRVAALSSGDLVLLPAGPQLAHGVGFSASSPLDSTLVLDEAERAAIGNAVTLLNAAIDQIATAPWVAKVDLNGKLEEIHQRGYSVGGTFYTDRFISGGLFSLDGIHPTDLGHAILANAMIEAVNRRFGTSVPYARCLNYASPSSSSARPAASGGRPLIPSRIEGIDDMLRMLFGFFH